jgi:hypothetical protein
MQCAFTKFSLPFSADFPILFSFLFGSQTPFLRSALDLNKPIRALATSSGTVYVAGAFSEAGGSAANGIVAWDGSSASGLAFGTDGIVYSLDIFQGMLIAGGAFTKAYQRSGGAVSTGGLARWDGQKWGVLGSALQGSVFAMTANETKLYVGGRFNQFVSTNFNGVAVYDGSRWSTMASPGGVGVEGGDVQSIAVSGIFVYVGGSFVRAGGVEAKYIARWDGERWSSVGDVDGYVHTISSQGGLVFAGGAFLSAGGNFVGGVALYREKLDGSVGDWEALGKGVEGSVNSVAYVYQEGCVYVGGDFTSVSDDFGTRAAAGFTRWCLPRESARGGTFEVATAQEGDAVGAVLAVARVQV